MLATIREESGMKDATLQKLLPAVPDPLFTEVTVTYPGAPFTNVV